MKNVDAILTADLHIQENAPVCRLDNWMETQERKHQWLSALQKKHGCPVLVAGDLFNHWKPNPFLIGWCGRNLANDIIAIPGQHDLEAHNLANIQKSGINALADNGRIILLDEPYGYNTGVFDVNGFPWGIELTQCKTKIYEAPQVALIHYGVYQNKPHYPGAEHKGGTAISVIKKMPGFDLIVSGDNHQTFTHHWNDGKRNTILVNPGSFMRTSAAQADFKPSVFLWCAATNEVEQVFIPIEKGVISREHIDEPQERNERLTAFVDRLDKNIELTISYKENMKRHLAKNKVKKSTSDIIWKSMP